ncbi:hypothetical protein ACFC18_40200 [Streptomyces sp. NPDC056121]|uniref:hypothetical protein n=1 Tax=Streptomyces TaxID=1883 RepID=UPI001D0A8DF8|nr:MULTISPECIES: hypothetical protein [Streptomyces]MCX5083991.1 hypothetical protein [Streptomyces sp. NBC_00401]UDM04662.1 hypothetical protein LGI35_43715 [Streptomyces longhuiensis]
MSDGIAWIGAHSTTGTAAPGAGMLGGISLTVARGFDEEDEFLIALGADLDELADGALYKDRGLVPSDAHAAMYGRCGEWTYVLEDWGMATWAAGWQGVKSMRPYPGEEIVCLTLNRWSPPNRIIHAPGDGQVQRADFGTDTGCTSDLDAALQAAGAVVPPRPDAGDELAIAQYEQDRERLPQAVFAAVGDYCGLVLDRAAITAGTLPGLVLPAVN